MMNESSFTVSNRSLSIKTFNYIFTTERLICMALGEDKGDGVSSDRSRSLEKKYINLVQHTHVTCSTVLLYIVLASPSDKL